MLNSKAINLPEGKKRSRLYLWWIDTDVYDWYRDFKYKFFKRPFQTAKKLYDWYVNVFKDDFDFDGHSLFAIIEYKLKRIKVSLDKGYSVQEPKDMKALKLATKLAGRLKDDNYADSFRNRHDRKWGEMKSWREPCNDGTGCSWWKRSRPNAVTEEEKELESKDLIAHCYAEEAKRKREERWMYDILFKHCRSWWD